MAQSVSLAILVTAALLTTLLAGAEAAKLKRDGLLNDVIMLRGRVQSYSNGHTYLEVDLDTNPTENHDPLILLVPAIGDAVVAMAADAAMEVAAMRDGIDGPPRIDALMTGDVVLVAGVLESWHPTAAADAHDDNNNSDIPSMLVMYLRLVERTAVRGLTPRISSVTFLTRICGQTSLTPDQVTAFRNRWTRSPTTRSDITTMSDLYGRCSANQTSFAAQDNIIVDLTNVDAPCSGTWQEKPWVWGKCTMTELQGWQAWYLNYATQVLKMDLRPYVRTVLVLPSNGLPCPWSGLASIGCGTAPPCRIWLQGAYVTLSLNTAFHELGHTLGLQHASTPTDSYGDRTSAMGSCCNERCMNAPQATAVGWARPIRISPLTDTFFAQVPIGTWSRQIVLPALEAAYDGNAGAAEGNFVEIRTARMSSPLFISFRAALPGVWPFQSGVTAPFLGISVHAFNGTAERPMLGPSQLLGTIAVTAADGDTRNMQTVGIALDRFGASRPRGGRLVVQLLRANYGVWPPRSSVRLCVQDGASIGGCASPTAY